VKQKREAEQKAAGPLWQPPTEEEGNKQIRVQFEETLRGAWRDFRFKIQPGSSLASTKMQRAQMFGELAKNGIADPRRVLRELGVENPDEEIKAAIEFMQMRSAAGLPPPDQGKGKKKS
jgi:hypothetical protein